MSTFIAQRAWLKGGVHCFTRQVVMNLVF